MGFDTGGTFTRYGGATIWQGDSASGKKIESKRHDDHDQEIANALSECLTRTGKGVPAVNIPWGGKKIVNLGAPTPNSSDAATTFYVDNLTGWSKSKDIGGTDLNGRLNFTGLSGVNGITWTYADMSFVARGDKPNEAVNRLVINPGKTPSTTSGIADVVVFDEFGNINASGKISNNLSWDGANWRTISPGYGSLLEYRTGGDFRLSSNDVATITNNYTTATLREFATLQNAAGSALLTLQKSAPFGAPLVQKGVSIRGMMTDKLRWLMYLGDAAAESGGGSGRVGSDFSIYSYNNNGDASSAERSLHINRSTNLATFGGAITAVGTVTAGALTTTGIATVDTTLTSSDTLLILASKSGGSIYLRPNGEAVETEQVYVSTAGDLVLQKTTIAATGGVYAGKGLRSKGGSTATAYQAQWMNLQYTGGRVRVWVDATDMGAIAYAPVDDASTQNNVVPLGSVWDKVKALNPIQFQQETGIIRWGFTAQEVRAALVDSAADGEPGEPQSTNAMAVIAALTRALQEAMQRIETLEAAA